MTGGVVLMVVSLAGWGVGDVFGDTEREVDGAAKLPES